MKMYSQERASGKKRVGHRIPVDVVVIGSVVLVGFLIIGWLALTIPKILLGFCLLLLFACLTAFVVSVSRSLKAEKRRYGSGIKENPTAYSEQDLLGDYWQND